MTEYVKSKRAYQEIRNIFGPYAGHNDFKRVPKTDASWSKSFSAANSLIINFAIDRWAAPIMETPSSVNWWSPLKVYPRIHPNGMQNISPNCWMVRARPEWRR